MLIQKIEKIVIIEYIDQIAAIDDNNNSLQFNEFRLHCTRLRIKHSILQSVSLYIGSIALVD